MSVKFSDSVKYIGVDDTTIDLFESQYVVPKGVSYNSYVILDDKVALMDTVDKRGMEQWEKNLTAALDGRAVDYLIIQHLEPDHACLLYTSHDKAALYVFNHRSFFDIVVGYATAPIPSAFVSKKEIEKVPMISWWMKYLNCLFLDRDDIRQGMKVILTGIELMKEGTNIFIAPEGTRNSSDELLPFHEASFKLAEKSKSPIVPVAMNNMDAVLEQHMPWIRRTHVIIEYCEPIYMDSMERAEKKKIGEKVRQIISDKIKENAAEV